ncbi:MAG: aminotransferase class I/II-fold pyridoxal phosphate-dependent enzyme [Alphaproteobacteria bacterium]|nr:aminotransferase class I/II-fold pyridoxal phosphate-dependent enzyme [Alphaproteobacteria bacterium]
MDDLAEANKSNQDTINMGGGSPFPIKASREVYTSLFQELANSRAEIEKLYGQYSAPAGNQETRDKLAGYLRKKFGWNVSSEHVAVTNGNQAALFVLFNMLGGPNESAERNEILFPLIPEYVGYQNLLLPGLKVRAPKPSIQILNDHLFEYRVDFSRIQVTEKTAAVCLSQPSNPAGKIHSETDLKKLDYISNEKGAPLIIDSAYGAPFPNIIFSECPPYWSENTILLLSLSKLGLPGLRSGLIVASPERIAAFSKFSTSLNLAPNSIGAHILTELVSRGAIDHLCSQTICNFYQEKIAFASSKLISSLADTPCRLHHMGGGFFIWLWCEHLPFLGRELYSRLKTKGVVVAPGEEFFLGLEPDWSHGRECIRISCALPDTQLNVGIELIADEIVDAYR